MPKRFDLTLNVRDEDMEFVSSDRIESNNLQELIAQFVKVIISVSKDLKRLEDKKEELNDEPLQPTLF